MFDFPSPATEGLTFTPSGGPQYVFTNGAWRMQGGNAVQSSLQDAAADMSIGFKTAGNRFVVNDKADLTGTDVMTVSEVGALTTAGTVTASNSTFAGNPAGTNVILCPTNAGTVTLRPSGIGVSTGQTTIDTNGTLNCAGNVYSNGGYSTTGVNAGVSIFSGFIRTSATVATSVQHMGFYNTNGAVGQITTNASATAYSTSSDERLKKVGADYDPAEAIAIIRADPVMNFKWKAGNIDAVGWIAQKSHAVHEDLATHIAPKKAGAKGEPAEEEFWGIDYGRRTPYLWAALTAALDKIDALEARLALLEGAA